MITDDIVTTWEPCAEFRAEPGEAVCDTCGWLDHEHTVVIAVRVTPSASSQPSSQAA